MRASVIILGFLATLTVALPEAYPEAAIACQSDTMVCTAANCAGEGCCCEGLTCGSNGTCMPL
ncbi:hypothetical protein E8E15_005461 [Penicillium rubens]|uniref:Uncharacterized protein n=1 Tax=Penicillium chrysogenum TaxID=5076 RepID=A0ABQ8WAE9_PENCH|nr:uncharacterized protein N7525_002152 [Penicillium rubens]KAJ5261770.1 hypothetical protein N7505_008637 [Penicillium chrysogenum]KAF3019954.1 hypothetical protein E8E15_005461 [Penicillium rubens]KAJ5844411.1 hypothetical protein N7525_002152 [Penicillium rubens]KAJ5844999.1 hypothetical protein N7534_008668 [Penicillium rubens]KAJ6159697.1 hypothetical protein N7497_004234 [Penicillium chrysogenum]